MPQTVWKTLLRFAFLQITGLLRFASSSLYNNLQVPLLVGWLIVQATRSEVCCDADFASLLRLLPSDCYMYIKKMLPQSTG